MSKINCKYLKNSGHYNRCQCRGVLKSLNGMGPRICIKIEERKECGFHIPMIKEKTL